MTGPTSTLLGSSLRSWLSAKGFWLVVIAALLPLVLTGAWAGGHQADVEVTELRVEGAPLEEGEVAHLVAVVRNAGSDPLEPFNVSLAVGTVTVFGSEARLTPLANTTTRIESLAPGETREVSMDWNATPGVVFALATADMEDAIGEREELNNQKDQPLAVGYRAPTTPPAAPPSVNGTADENATEVDLAVTALARSSESLRSGDNATFTATFQNHGADIAGATAHVRVVQMIGGRPVTRVNVSETLDLQAGATKDVQLAWTALPGAYWIESFVVPPTGTRDVDPASNHRADPLVANPSDDFGEAPTPPDRPTIKMFYTDLLGVVYLRLVLPLIALFYAAGVIADEREQGALPYLLTRPVPRWLIPLAKFVGSFAVAALAVIIGVTATFLLLFGATSGGRDIGFLTTPLLASLLTIFVYGAIFTLLGTIFERPYLVGLVFLGWETIAVILGSVVGLASWVRNLTVLYHVQNAMNGWTLDGGAKWIPEGQDAIRALLVALGIGIAALAAAAIHMKRREFDLR